MEEDNEGRLEGVACVTGVVPAPTGAGAPVGGAATGVAPTAGGTDCGGSCVAGAGGLVTVGDEAVARGVIVEGSRGADGYDFFH